MGNWEAKFQQTSLDKGRELYLNNKVVDLQETENGYTAAVLTRERYAVTVRTLASGRQYMNCRCPVARMGRNCEHLAALMYAVDSVKSPEKDIKKIKEDRERKQREEEQAEILRRIDAEREAKEKRLEAARKAEEKKRREAEKEAEELRRQEAERAAQEQKRREAEAAAREQQLLKEREEKRRAREARKAERARAREEQKRLAEEAARAEREKRLAEEARREKIRQEKAEEAKRRAEKKQKEQEALEKRKEAEERYRLAEEKRRMAEEKRREAEEKRRMAEEKRHEAEEKQRREAEEKRRLAAEKKQKEKEQQMEREKLLEEKKRQEADRKHLAEQEKRKTEYAQLGGSGNNEADPENSRKRILELENYRYFNGTRIRNSVTVQTQIAREGEMLYRAGKIQLRQVISGFDNRDDARKGQLDAVGKDGRYEFPIRAIFTRKEIRAFHCECKNCRTDYYEQFNVKKTGCPYKAGALILLEDYLKEHNIGDATDATGRRLLSAFEEKRVNLTIADTEAKEESLQLVPRLMRKGGKLSLSFKVGAGKLFVVKKLDEFCENVRSSATETYGNSTEINHDINNFTEEGKGWIRFINRIAREEQEFQQRLYESRSYYGSVKSSIGNALELFGWRLDEFYDQLGQEEVEFDDKDSFEKKKKVSLSCRDCNPKVSMRITEDVIPGSKEFHGVKVDGNLPDLYHGTDTAYYISENHLNRVDKEFLQQIEPLEEVAFDSSFAFRVGRNSLSEFYQRVLPKLREIADITEVKPEKIRQYLLPEAQFIFYLDMEENDAICRIYAQYGDIEVSVLEGLPGTNPMNIEPFRDVSKENEILYFASKWLPVMDSQRQVLCCDGDESLIYQLMKNGTEKLMELGEVRCTKRFLGHHTVNRMKVSVGVSVSSGLLELDIATEDVPAAELLDILRSYRAKKKYYRLKDGAFVDLEEPSLEMLLELSEAMNLKDKELLKGKLKLPMFRTLYLDKLLEENDSVYSSRDSRFREMVKEFKTVKDADFEIPESLSKLMRKYQQDGYRWLRTLETWQFGGILADDMGLGKTLQVIAVLAAAKETAVNENVLEVEQSRIADEAVLEAEKNRIVNEAVAEVEQKEVGSDGKAAGKSKTALVVTPASLVFNWGAEFEKFAPELTVSLVTGTQEERQKKIEAYQDVDVLVTSYDLLKRDIALYEGKTFAYQIIDEAQYIKNYTTAAAKAVKGINSRIRYALTGTPIENRLSELWSIFDYLMPGFLYGYDVFKKEIETPIVKNDDEKAMQRLQKMVGPFILRRLKEDVLKDLPEKLEEFRYVRLGDAQQKVYDGQVVHMKEQIARQNADEFNKNKLQILAELTRLRQICCDPALCFENYRGEAAKLEACLDLIQSAIDGGHRVLVFSQFTSMLEILQNELDRSKTEYYTITGSTSKEKRLELVKSFNEGTVPVFLISLKAGGVGLNLTGADVVIHYDPWWNLAAQNQATDRAHRIGQMKKVTVYKLIARHTIEEKIQKLQETKKNLADQVMSGEMGGLGSMSQEEILELLEI